MRRRADWQSAIQQVGNLRYAKQNQGERVVNGLYPGHATRIRIRQHINGWNDPPKRVRAIVIVRAA